MNSKDGRKKGRDTLMNMGTMGERREDTLMNKAEETH